MTASELVAIFDALPDGSFVGPDLSGNLIVTDKAGDEYRGYIDMTEGKFVEAPCSP